MYYIITEEKVFPKSLVVKYPNHKIYRSVEFIEVGQEEGFNGDVFYYKHTCTDVGTETFCCSRAVGIPLGFARRLLDERRRAED